MNIHEYQAKQLFERFGVATPKGIAATTAQEAAQIARDAEVKKLLIGHFSARYDDEQVLLEEARSVFPNTQLAKETLCISV